MMSTKSTKIRSPESGEYLYGVYQTCKMQRCSVEVEKGEGKRKERQLFPSGVPKLDLVDFNRGQSLAFWTLGVGISDGGYFFAIVVCVVLLFRFDGRLCAIILATRLAAAF